MLIAPINLIAVAGATTLRKPFHHDRGRFVLPFHRGAVNKGVRDTPKAAGSTKMKYTLIWYTRLLKFNPQNAHHTTHQS